MAFLKEFMSSSNEKVNSATVIASILAIPTMLLALVVIVYHSFVLGKGLDSNVVNLILGLLGGGGIGYGIGHASARFGASYPSCPPPPPKPAPPPRMD